MVARTVGVRLGKAVGWTAATLYKGGEALIGATGELGEGFGEGVAVGWEDRCEAMDQLAIERQAKREAKLAEMVRVRAEAKAKVAAEATTTRKAVKATA